MKPLLLVSQSNSGSSWFARCLAEAHPELRYFDKEFFNPMMNHRHAARLSRSLGCELHSTVDNLASVPDPEDIDQLIASTWGAEAHGFTKENFLAFKIPAFARTFEVFFLFRGADYCFPPERSRVRQWYDAWFWSLWRGGRFTEGQKEWLCARQLSSHERAAVAWMTVRAALQTAARELDLEHRIVDWERCLEYPEDRLPTYLAGVLPPRLSADRVAERILATRRRPEPAPEAHGREWQGALTLAAQFAEFTASGGVR